MTENPQFQEIESKRQLLSKLRADADRIQTGMESRLQKSEARSAAVEVAQAVLNEAKLAQVLSPSKENAAAVAEAQRRVKDAYAAETGDIQDEEIVQAALQRLNADIKRIEVEVRAAERDYLRSRVSTPASTEARLVAIEDVLADEVIDYQTRGLGGFDFGLWLSRVVRVGRVHDIAARRMASMLKGEV